MHNNLSHNAKHICSPFYMDLLRACDELVEWAAKELRIFLPLSAATYSRQKNTLPFCKNLNAYTHTNPDKNVLTNESTSMTRKINPPAPNLLLLQAADIVSGQMSVMTKEFSAPDKFTFDVPPVKSC